jgi:hypothetical protein
VDRDEEVPADEEVDVLGFERLLSRAWGDGVQDEIQQSVVGFDFGMVNF